jgi:DNA-binding NarL/FixJ family response regulator
MNTIRILMADDHRVVRRGLCLLLESQPGFQVVAEASDGRQAVALAAEHTPDIVVLDVAMPLLNGIEAARQISAKFPQIGIVFLSMHSDESYVLKALKSGGKAYLLKESAEYDLINAIRAVDDGKAFFSPAINKMLADEYMRQLREREVEDSYDLLTTRERETLQLFAEAKTPKEVAAMLNLHSTAELILYAVRKGVIA